MTYVAVMTAQGGCYISINVYITLDTQQTE